MRLSIADEIVARHREVLVGGLLATGLLEASARLAEAGVPGDTQQALVDRGLTIEQLANEPIVADWRAAIRACGVKPSTFKGSVEQMARRTLKSGPLKTPLPLVDLYCDVATRHLAPMGAYDVSLLPADEVVLRLADPAGDVFHPLGAKEGEMPLTPQVAVYASDHTVICWAYNCRDSRETCLGPDTEVGLFVGEAITGRQHQPLRDAFGELADRLRATGAAVGEPVYADAANPAVTLPEPQ